MRKGTYSYDEGGYGIELWEHDFATIAEAEHAKRVLNNRPCIVHYSPECVGVTTLLWSEVKAELEREPYVPKPVQLVRSGRVGYRWGTGAAVLACSGLAASAAVYGMAMGDSPWCVCEADAGSACDVAGGVDCFDGFGEPGADAGSATGFPAQGVVGDEWSGSAGRWGCSRCHCICSRR
jgi:hypothetical protein